MTSNVGFHDDPIGFQKNKKTETKLKESLEIPFINRVDNVVEFTPLSKDHIKEIIKKNLKEIKEKYPHVTFHSKIEKEILELSNYEEYGARKISKIVKDKVENKIIEDMIHHRKSELVSLKDMVET